jgi:hypothetical protein
MRTAPALACALALILSGIAHGLFTDRWKTVAEIGDIQPRLDRLPAELGTWTSVDIPMAEEQLDRAAIRAYLSREYRDAHSGEAVRVLVVAGRPGPISVHTPDICFQGAGYTLAADPEPVSFGGAEGQLWSGTFVKQDTAIPHRLRIHWGWHGGSGWEAPDHRTARIRYSLRPVLYKLYLVTEAPLTRNPSQAEAFDAFASRLLPELDRLLTD